MSDLCNDLAKKHGEWYPFAKEHAFVNGQWLGVPLLYTSFPGSHPRDNAPRSLGIWKSTKNAEPAREFLKWFFEPAQYHEWIMSGESDNHPMWRDMENHPVWDLDPKYKPIRASVQYSHLYGWPAPPDERTQLITNTYVIPNMFAKVVTNSSTPKDAIAWAENEIKKAFQ